MGNDEELAGPRAAKETVFGIRGIARKLRHPSILGVGRGIKAARARGSRISAGALAGAGSGQQTLVVRDPSAREFVELPLTQADIDSMGVRERDQRRHRRLPLKPALLSDAIPRRAVP